MVGLSPPHPRWSRHPSPSPPTSPTPSTRFPSPTNPSPSPPSSPEKAGPCSGYPRRTAAAAAADLLKMYKELGAKAWESTVRRTQAAARKHAAIFSAMSVAHADDDGGPARPHHAQKPLPNGELYTGDWAGEAPHGVGKYLWADRCMYEGEWARGKMTGKGKFSWPSGATYEGEFKGGYMDGFGTYTGAGGETYRGHWMMNLKHGAGWKSYCNGDYYDGEWRCGVQDGRGRYVWSNGSEYDGEWRDGAMAGKGALLWSTGNRYVGNWEDGTPAGDGRFLWPDGSFYVGVWSRDPKERSGSYYPAGASSPANNHGWDHQKVYEVYLKECKVCSDEKVSILPSQKRFNWDKGWRSKTPPRMRTFSAPAAPAEGWDGERREAAADGSGEPCTVGSFNPATLPKVRRRQGETISKGHKNFELMLSLQLGIRHSVGRPGPAVSLDLKASAFDPKEKLWTKFPPEGSKHTPPHHSCDFRWKDYCPLVFRKLRKLFKIDPADYMLSICGNDALRELSSPGKSGSFFYLTHDDNYMIKTMKKSEVKVLLRMLPAYYEHVRAFENTLVTKFFGLHCVKLTGATQRKVRFVIMGNLFCSEYPIQRRFDLKGSSLGRITDKPAGEINENTTLKDLDLNFIFRLQKCWIQEMHWQVDRDCEFLEQERIMDYSLLVGLHFRDSCTTELGDAGSLGNKTFMGSPESDIDTSPCLSRADNGLLVNDPNDRWPSSRLGINMPARAEQTVRKYDSSGEPQLIGEPNGYFYDVVLYLGIIDMLQDYDISKKLEHAYKSIQHDPTSMSAVDPKQYSRRFRDFIVRAFVEDASSSNF